MEAFQERAEATYPACREMSEMAILPERVNVIIRDLLKLDFPRAKVTVARFLHV